MKILLVVTSANDVFIYNMAKWLKKSLDCSLDAFELYPSSTTNQEDSGAFFDIIETAHWNSWWGQNKLTRFIFSPIMIARQLNCFVTDKHYDIIHVHGVWFYVPFVKKLKEHTEKLFVCFWGSEWQNGKVWMSHSIFSTKLKRFMKKVDGIVGAYSRLKHFHELYPQVALYQAALGAASMDRIIELTHNSTKEESKKYWNIPKDKVSVLIGYSGKQLHNHLGIIKGFNKHPELSDTVHLLAPMTRGADAGYVAEVENALEKSAFTYTLIKDRFLSDEDIAQLRFATDVVFQFATQDAYSRSIIECLCAGAILIYGDWINYKTLLSDDCFEACDAKDIDKGISILKDYIQARDKYQTIAEHNIQNGGRNYLWSECIKNWVDIYTGNKNAEVF